MDAIVHTRTGDRCCLVVTVLIFTDLDRALAPAFCSVLVITSQSQLAEPSLAGPFAEGATEG